jgi:hypothetical protein
MKKSFISYLFYSLSLLSATAQDSYEAKISFPQPPKGGDLIRMGTAASPRGTVVGINSQALYINNRAVVPAMGEIHYARVHESEWRRELLKMKAGGIDIASSYVFWIIHEEIEGKYNWTGQRNIRGFLEACRSANMPIVLRIGPWNHGEIRNGGFPDWIIDQIGKDRLRTSDKEYLEKVNIWFRQLFSQVEGLLWKDGGPVIGIQLENEYSGTWEHLMELKQMACNAGFDVPLYTRTGWPLLKTPAVFGEMVPLYGGYAEGFWNREPEDMPGSDYKSYFIFRSFRNGVGIATEQLPPQAATENPAEVDYPMFACETGGGMVPSYHRRVNVQPMDIYSLSLVQLGSGCNMPGYYMYHGGINPEGARTHLNEVQNSSYTYWNDLPAMSYEWHAPLGAFGQVNEHYHILRRMHIFLRDFGNELALMPPIFPDKIRKPEDADNSSSLRWSVRSNGRSGYIFVNNYQRLQDMPEKKDVKFRLHLPEEDLNVPAENITVAANTCFFIPFNMQVEGIKIKYATAQPVARIKEGRTTTLFFTTIKGLQPDFVFDAQNIKVNHTKSRAVRNGKNIHVNNPKTGTGIAISLQDRRKETVNIVLLDDTASLSLWKAEYAGRERIFLSGSELITDGSNLELTDTAENISVSVYPSFKSLKKGNNPLPGKKNGIFTLYELNNSSSAPLPTAAATMTREADKEFREMKKGRAGVAECPVDKDFDKAAIWKINISGQPDATRDLYLRLPYYGDAARIYAGEKLLTDDYYNGTALEIGLRRYSTDLAGNELTVRILPLEKNAPVHISRKDLPKYNESGYALSLLSTDIYEKKTVVLTAEN